MLHTIRRNLLASRIRGPFIQLRHHMTNARQLLYASIGNVHNAYVGNPFRIAVVCHLFGVYLGGRWFADA